MRFPSASKRVEALAKCYDPGMTDAWTQPAVVGLALAMGVALGCAGRSKGANSPGECLSKCDQEQCEYVANSLGDNDEYLECLEACEDKCNK